MTVAQTMEAIEQDEFAAEMNLSAGTRAFRRAIREHKFYDRLLELAKRNPSELAGRIEAISHIEVDERYENRFDTALSAYLMVLSDVAEPETTLRASQAALRAPRTWWASAIARELVLQTVAVGAIGAGADCGDSVYARFNAWVVAL